MQPEEALADSPPDVGEPASNAEDAAAGDETTASSLAVGPCTRCGYRWHSRVAQPRFCARCHSRQWNQERKANRAAGLTDPDTKAGEIVQRRHRQQLEKRLDSLVRKMRESLGDRVTVRMLSAVREWIEVTQSELGASPPVPRPEPWRGEVVAVEPAAAIPPPPGYVRR